MLVFLFLSVFVMSLSARRAWIEIPITLDSGALPGVSLSARRAWIEIRYSYFCDSLSQCRSPQGERG